MAVATVIALKIFEYAFFLPLLLMPIAFIFISPLGMTPVSPWKAVVYNKK